MSDINVLYDDILCIIIDYLGDECVMLTRTCHRMHDLTHHVHKTLLITSNVFEAVRCGSLLSFMHADANNYELLVATSMNDATDDMLLYAYDKTEPDITAYQLCKRGVLVDVSNDVHQYKLIVHAIMHNDHDLLKHMKNVVDSDNYNTYCAYGAAKKGDIYMFEKHRCHVQYYDAQMKYYASIGGCKHIMNAVGCDKIPVKHIDYITNIIKRDDHIAFDSLDLMGVDQLYVCDTCIKYDAVKIARQYRLCDIIIEVDRVSLQPSKPVDMTLKMAEMLIEMSNDDLVVRYIANSCNYRLTEMLRERHLHGKKLTIRSSHTEFVI